MSSRRTQIAAGLALVVGVAIRVLNAFEYNFLWGFDAHFNWRYIKYLTTTWALPHPEALWSAAHPPLFYYMSAALVRALGNPIPATSVITLRLVGTAMGLATVGLAYVLVRRISPDRPRRALLAAGLLLFLPVHIYTSAMLGEEMVATFLISLVLVGLASELEDPARPYQPLYFAALLGALAGLAFLTKLTGVLVAAVVCATYLVDGWRRGALSAALYRVAILVVVTALIGGWFYAWNLFNYGYLYPHGLQIHQVMYTMPPGTRYLADYFYLPLAIWTDPQVLNPDLLRSVWGSTYVTMWFEGHRSFLPHSVSAVDRVGAVILVLALLPMAAFATGVVRGFRRASASASGPDTLILMMIGLTMAGYVLFTWRNPFFAVCKASFLLSLSVPFAFYASEVLDDWIGRGRRRAAALSAVLIAGALLITATFSKTEFFWNMDHMPRPGLVWASRSPATGIIHRR